MVARTPTTPANTAPIPGWDGYLISRDGELFSCRTKGGKTGGCWQKKLPSLSRDGYLQVKLYHRCKTYFVGIHSLVLMAWCGPRPDGCQSCHINGVRTDNRIENLRWGTPQSNIDDRERHGTTARGERGGRAVLTAAGVRELFELREQGLSYGQIAAKSGISKRQVMRVCKRQAWMHLHDADRVDQVQESITQTQL